MNVRPQNTKSNLNKQNWVENLDIAKTVPDKCQRIKETDIIQKIQPKCSNRAIFQQDVAKNSLQ